MINKEALKLIKDFEGHGYFKWYPDPAHGWKVPTVGYGHTDQAGPPYYKDTKNKTFTQKEIDDILLNDLKKYEAGVRRQITAPLNENQYGALVSFTFNLGEGNLQKSTLRRKVNSRDYRGAADEFPKWNKAGGKVLNGLIRRRAAERALFLKSGSNTVDNPISIPEAPQEETTLFSVITKVLRLLFGVK